MLDLPRILTRARSWLGDRFFPPARVVLPARAPLADRVIATVGRSLRVRPADITSGARYQRAIAARHASALALRRLGLSFPEIARTCGWSETQTAVRAVEGAGVRLINPAFAAAVDAGVLAGGVR